jgi:tetratricopeptide (TPR) repeat protein
MSERTTGLLLAVAVLILSGAMHAAADDPPKPSPEVSDARRAGLKLARVILERLEADDQSKFPGIQAWLKDLRKATRAMNPEKPVEGWPALDADALMAHNPNFWQAYYEIAPGDPGLMVIQAGLLTSAGEMTRASHILVVALQRPGIPTPFRKAMLGLLAETMKAGKTSNALVNEGIKLHDKGEYAAALRKYDEALAAWPQNGFAHYEVGYTIYAQSLVAAGEKPPAPGTVIVNGKGKLSAKTGAAYAKARHHDPLQYMAYQGGEKAVIDGFRALAAKGLPVWQKLAKEPEKRVDDRALQDFAEACQAAGIHELGLAARQVMVARRGSYAPSDHPYLTASLRKLAPGEQTDALLKRLATGVLSLRQLVAPEEEKRAFKHNRLRLYVPTPELPKRIGEDVEPLANYIKALDEPIQQWLEKEKPKANGLLIAVGIKAGKKSRAWCQAVEGDVPAAALQRLEKELGKVATIDLKKGPVAFGLEVVIGGRKVEKFPAFPAVWLEALKKSKVEVIVPPDELFKLIWPD